MSIPPRATIRAKGTGDVAFAVLVCVSYLAMISNAFASLTLNRLVWLMLLGTLYILLGIYGFASAQNAGSTQILAAYFLIQIGLSATIVYLGRGAGFNALLMLPLAGQAVVALSQNGMLAVSVGILLGYVGAVYWYSGGLSTLWESLVTFLAGLVFVVVFTQLTVDEERARAEVERLAEKLEDANHKLRAYAAQAEELATIRERNRLAREIHDGLGHYLTTVHMQIQAGQAVLDSDPQKAEQAFDKARELTQTALAEVRRSVGTLRTPEGEQPLLERLKALLHDSQSPGLTAELAITGVQRPLSPQTELACFRAAQEGLNNVRKHSGATRATLMLDYSKPSCLILTLSDNGQGAGDLSGGYGLLGMRERLELVGGKMDIDTTPGAGFILRIEVPG